MAPARFIFLYPDPRLGVSTRRLEGFNALLKLYLPHNAAHHHAQWQLIHKLRQQSECCSALLQMAGSGLSPVGQSSLVGNVSVVSCLCLCCGLSCVVSSESLTSLLPGSCPSSLSLVFLYSVLASLKCLSVHCRKVPVRHQRLVAVSSLLFSISSLVISPSSVLYDTKPSFLHDRGIRWTISCQNTFFHIIGRAFVHTAASRRRSSLIQTPVERSKGGRHCASVQDW